MKRAIIAGGTFAAIVLGALAVAVAGAQSASPTDTPVPSATPAPGNGTDDQMYSDFYLNDLASRLNISVDELKSDMQASQKALVAKALADGKITQAQADDLNARIDAGEKIYFRFFLDGGRHGVRAAINSIVDEAAKVLGIDSSEVKDGLKAGTSLQDIAGAHGMSADAFKSALLAQAKTDLDAKVASGDITQDRADQIYQKFSDNIDTIVTDTRGDAGPPFGRFGGQGFGFGHHDDKNDGGSSATPAPSGTTTIF